MSDTHSSCNLLSLPLCANCALRQVEGYVSLGKEDSSSEDKDSDKDKKKDAEKAETAEEKAAKKEQKEAVKGLLIDCKSFF